MNSKKKEVAAQNNGPQSLPFEPPVLKRLGTLRELTRGFNGSGKDSGLPGMSFPM